ncbi:putative CcdB-like protein [Roseovarius sp. EC-HK134]|jgi:toxin CcdB|uniref:CcdB family protein n=1 Tax=unclassified Roseovarius TaxID=2614913 RepID=UPI00125A15A7|nr:MULTISPECIES: CcdB family protein [unclassified Roseovarius]VVT13317.1 putative CcdB-like protein [Roseovarius sp. EC-SD190]VVT18416.1 putative CcdB-like protein [Roseovarius sp. EC-HK134]|tara:strand:+ start:434 stop:733 length:300 start_codon:yes stop_codon:yes gene_type:complete
MAQYDLFATPAGDGYLLDVQNDLLDGLNVRAVVPLLPQGRAPIAASRLNPVFDIDGAPHLMMTQYIAAVPVGILKARVGDLSERFDAVTSALDMLFHGF